MVLPVAIAVGATALSIREQRRAQEEQRRAARAQRRIADAQAARQRSQAAREALIARASAENVSAATGGGGSRLAGASSSIAAQLGSNLGFSFQTQALSNSASRALQRSADAQTRASIFRSIGSTAFNFVPPGQLNFGNSSQGTT